MQPRFTDVLEAVEELPTEDKEELIRIVQNRLRDDERQRILNSVKESQREFEKGNMKTSTVDEIMEEILS